MGGGFPGYESLDKLPSPSWHGGEFFNGESYERTLKFIELFSVFSVPGDNFVKEIHKKVFADFSGKANNHVMALIWNDLPSEILNDPIIKSSINNVDINDNKYALDFQPLLNIKRCSRLYPETADRNEKIRSCFLFNNISISENDEIEIQTEFFALANKLAIEFADPYGYFIREKELNSSDADKADILTPSIVAELWGSVAYLQFSSFLAKDLPLQLQEKLAEFNGKGIKGLILDVRGNTGGVHSIALKVASLFLPEYSPLALYRERDGTGKWKEPVCDSVAKQDGNIGTNTYQGPLVVLTDHFTASASELLIAALQTNKRALVIGQETYGKGVGWLIAPLWEIGYHSLGAMTLTTMILYNPETEMTWHRAPLSPHIRLEEVSKRTSQEWDALKGTNSYRQASNKCINNRDLNIELKRARGALSYCPPYTLPLRSGWEPLIEDLPTQNNFKQTRLSGVFADDLPLSFAFMALDLMATGNYPTKNPI